MTEHTRAPRVIPARQVRQVDAPVLVECTSGPDRRNDTITVIPLAEGGAIQGFEVRCQCGATVVVECVYDEEK